MATRAAITPPWADGGGTGATGAAGIVVGTAAGGVAVGGIGAGATGMGATGTGAAG
jgi:hypothetical protein